MPEPGNSGVKVAIWGHGARDASKRKGPLKRSSENESIEAGSPESAV